MGGNSSSYSRLLFPLTVCIKRTYMYSLQLSRLGGAVGAKLSRQVSAIATAVEWNMLFDGLVRVDWSRSMASVTVMDIQSSKSFAAVFTKNYSQCGWFSFTLQLQTTSPSLKIFPFPYWRIRLCSVILVRVRIYYAIVPCICNGLSTYKCILMCWTANINIST